MTRGHLDSHKGWLFLTLVLNTFISLNKKKNCVNKNQRCQPIHQKYKAKENTYKHNPKKKKNQQKSSKDLMQRGFMVTK
jgi:hypothetical protein